ncbi:hypothetical protein LZC95_02860 [Pendulispora brunnea]|uniref:Uncharacterized protein n=1 Tax=Pendulispora brunnea TaxID=2905690 RepID=A0ABZ2KFC0_9BACT
MTTNYGTAQWIDYDLSRFATVSGQSGLVPRWTTTIGTGTGEHYGYHTDTQLQGKRFWSWFPANTIQTFEIDGVTL